MLKEINDKVNNFIVKDKTTTDLLAFLKEDTERQAKRDEAFMNFMAVMMHQNQQTPPSTATYSTSTALTTTTFSL